MMSQGFFRFGISCIARSFQPQALALIIVVIAMVLDPAAGRAAVSCGHSGYTKLSTVSGCLGAGSSCTISSKVYVDQSFTRVGGQPLGSLTIAAGGELAFPSDASTRVEVANISINGGTLRIGAPECPISGGNLVELDFYGTNPGTLTCGDSSTFDKGICFVNGRLSIIGAKGVETMPTPGVSWTHLRCPAGPIEAYGAGNGLAAPVQGAAGACPGDAVTLAIQGKVDWAQNDWIVVGGTGYADDQAEFVKIGTITPNGGNTDITLTTPLLHYHFGGVSPNSATGSCIAGDGKTIEPPSFCAGAKRNYGVDERAEVGLISRNVRLSGRQAWEANATYETGATIVATVSNQAYVFQATTGGLSGSTPPAFPASGTVTDNAVTWTNEGYSNAAGDLHWGGEIKLLAGAAAAKSVTIEGAELEEFGKDQLGSYPIHFHMVGTVPSVRDGGPIVAYNSIHHGYNKCITVHMTDGVAITGNVCARVVGHLFYLESGQETGNTFTSNLGLGAMNNALSIAPGELSIFWNGDNLADSAARPLNYDEFNVPYTEDTTVPNRGPSSGFWISNANNNFIGNSIGGCQGSGVGYWYEESTVSQFEPFGTFQNNRVHGCQYGLLTVDDLGNVVSGSTYGKTNPTPHKGGGLFGAGAGGEDLIAVIKGITATRNRNRGVWVRPAWYHIVNARLAGNRDGASIVTGGGAEGIAPGVWGLISDSVIVGISRNNPDRFGPSECFNTAPPSGQEGGCITEPYLPTPNNNVIPPIPPNNGYPSPYWNLAGVMFYDGPARIKNIRFVNFKRTPLSSLTTADQTNLTNYNAATPDGYKTFANYEGDAAIGWFQSNVNAYPPTQSSEGLSWDNVDFKHQVYTQQVNLAPFVDGDKNTVILDRDGTLSGYGVVDSKGNSLAKYGRFPISLNNLPLNSVTNQSVGGPTPSDSVDECDTEGIQDATTSPPGNTGEGRSTAMMAPGEYATLEITNLSGSLVSPTGGFQNDDLVTLTKDQIDYPGVQLEDKTLPVPSPTPSPVTQSCPIGHGCIILTGRNQEGIYEPKVESGLGYTIASNEGFPGPATVGPYVSVGFTDATLPVNAEGHISPFSVRIGVCFKDQNGNQPKSIASFQVLQGRKSYGSPAGNALTLTPDYWNDLSVENQSGLSPALSRFCGQLDNTYIGAPTNGYPNIDPSTGCPAPNPNTAGAPGQGSVVTLTPQSVTTSTMPATLDPTKFYYDATTGMLYFQMMQSELNAQGESPLGSCPGNSACTKDQHFYPCPANGCPVYTIRVTDGSYAPNSASGCVPYDSTTGYTIYNHGVWDAYPSGLDQLAYIVPASATNNPAIGNYLDPDTKDGANALILPVEPNTVASENYPYNNFGTNGRPWCPENLKTTP
jgi:hypothetical protein